MAFFPARLRRSLLIVGAIAAAISLAPAAALADPALARKHFELGKRYYQVEELRKAIDEFKAAHIEEPDPAFLYNIAECYRRLGEANEAIGFYRRYLSLTPQNAPMRAMAAQHITELEATRAAPPQAPAVAPAPPVTPPPVAVAPPPKLAPPPPSEPAPGTALVASAPAGERPAETPTRPLYERGWFYGVVGAVLVGAAVGVWALSSGGGTSPPSTPLGNQTAFGR